MKNKNSQTRGAFALSFIALTVLALSSFVTVSAAAPPIPKPDGKPADMTKPVQVFVLLGQSNMVGLGKVKGGEISLEHAVKEKKKYQYLVDDAGAWTERQDVRFVRYKSGNGPLNNEWMTVKGNTLGTEFGIGHPLGNAIDAPVMILKCCIGNRSLGWDLAPPGRGDERGHWTLCGKANRRNGIVADHSEIAVPWRRCRSESILLFVYDDCADVQPGNTRLHANAPETPHRFSSRASPGKVRSCAAVDSTAAANVDGWGYV